MLSFSLYEGLVYGFLALGVYLTFRVLAFPDLTVDGSFVLGAAVVAVLIINGVNPFLATLAALGAGLCAGMVTSLLNTKLRVPALLASILVMVSLYSVNLRIMGRPNLPLLREVTIFSLTSQLLGLENRLTYQLVVAAVLALIVFFALNWFLRTEIGLALRATGNNEQMVRGAGVDTDKTTILGVSIANGLVAFSGGVVAQAQGFVDVNMGIGMIIIGLASVIIGEALFRPKGVARLLLAALGGAFVYRLVLSIALRAGMAPGDLKLITAVIVIVAMAVPFLQKRIRREWLPPAPRW
ncbi:MAG: ABC transporter permease [Dehalococcoidia bacterium]|nr:ABC transporter permease [Dehalococcoidia bacterium]RLC64039.1 MAG: ABC transporter permease [Chloroflexota bacterium]